MQIKDYILDIPNAERRMISDMPDIEMRAIAEAAPEIFGYGAVFGKPSRVMRTKQGEKFIEIINRNAFDHLIEDGSIVVLFNHDANFPIGRNKRSATIGTDDNGFWYKLNPPNSPLGQNIQESIKRGDVRTSSFSFIVSEKNEEWQFRKDEPAIRTINKFDRVFDLGPVTFEAYPDTSVVTRNFSVFDDYKKDLAEMDLAFMKRDLKLK